MATSTTKNRASSTNGAAQVVERRISRVRIPLLNLTVEVPNDMVPYYAGIGLMAALNLVDWPVAFIIAAGHTIATQSRNQALRELGGGVEAGA